MMHPPTSAATPSGSTVTPTAKTVVTPDQSRAILANYETVSARANSSLNPRLLATVEVGPVLAADKQAYNFLARQRTTSLPTGPLVSSTVYVHVQNTWPAFFVAFETRANFNDVLLFQQTKKGAPWKVALRANSLTNLTSLNIPTDAAGYVTKTGAKADAIPTRRAGAATCNYADQVGIDQVLPTLDGGVAVFNQELAAARATNSAKGFKTTARCTAEMTPLASLDSPDGSWVIYSVQWTETTAGVRSHASTRSTTVGMFAALVSAAPAGPTPIAIPFATITATTVGKTLKGATGVSGPSQPAPGVIPSLWAGYPNIDPSWRASRDSNGNIATNAGSTNVNFSGQWFSAANTALPTQAQYDAIPGFQVCAHSVRLGTVALPNGQRVPNNVLASAPCRSAFFYGQVNGTLANEIDVANFGVARQQRFATSRVWYLVSPDADAALLNPNSPGGYTAQAAGGVPPSVIASEQAGYKRTGIGVVCLDLSGVDQTPYTYKLNQPGGTYRVVNFTTQIVGLDGAHYCDSPSKIDYTPPAVFKAALKPPVAHQATTHRGTSSDSNWLIYVLAVVLLAAVVALLWARRRQHEPQQDETTDVAAVASRHEDTDDDPAETEVAAPETPRDEPVELDDAGLRDGGVQ
jgi:hypothetical protein